MSPQEELDKLRIKYNKKVNQFKKLKMEYDRLEKYHKKVITAISSLPFSIDEFIGDD